MGAQGSTSGAQAGAQAGHQQQQYQIPDDPVPYRGPQIQYHFINLDAKLSVKAFSQMITTNIEEYYQALCQPYAQDFVMKQFMKIPGVQRQAGFTSISMPYQGILVRPCNVPIHEKWQLRVDKSSLQTQAFASFGPSQRVSADTTEIQQKILDVAAQCGRLICIEVTGFQKVRNTFTSQSGVSGVDLFFNMPLHPNPTRYVYQAVNVPINCKLKSSFPTPNIEMETDIVGIFTAWLNQGWKLVEINFDMSQHAHQTGFTTARMSQNSIWFWEKEESRVNDNTTPAWQGCVLEYMHKTSATFGGTQVKGSWDELLGQMGQRGWELATMLETLEVRQTGLSSITKKLLMFFQRRILAPAPPAGVGPTGYQPPEKEGDPSNAPPPPSYDDAVTAPYVPQASAPGPPAPGFNVQ